MAIDKMTLVSIEGQLRKVNRTLVRCCESECFHIIPYTHDTDANFSSQSFKSLKLQNYYTPLVKRALNIADTLGIKLGFCEHDDVEYLSSGDFSDYFFAIERVLDGLVKEKNETNELISQYEVALSQVERLSGLNSNFEEIFAMKYIKVRFGRFPVDSFPKLKFFDDRAFVFQPFETQGDYMWGVYFVPNEQCVIVDDIFKSLFFERVRYPGYLQGTAEFARAHIIKLIRTENEKLESVGARLEHLRDSIIEEFAKVYCKLKSLCDSYDLRENVAVVNNKFFLSGYIPSSEAEKFAALIEDIEGVQVQVMPYTQDSTVKPPVKLKNNWFNRPFEMFVNMYGLPGYGRIDPTPFVAITYFIIYGIMFGDLGQGLIISSLGLILKYRSKLQLASVMIRIGISSALFGVVYGSVFGREDIIEPIFMHKSVYQALGMAESPKDIFAVSSYLLIGALSAGIFVIVITMLMNIIASIRTRDFKEGFLGSNGVTGLVLYCSAVVGAVLQLGFNIKVMTLPYVLPLIVLPLLLLFFKEPITELWHTGVGQFKLKKLYKNTTFVHAVEMYSDAVSNLESHSAVDFDLQELIECEFIKYQYGVLPLDGYYKLKFFNERKFFFFPFESDAETVKGVYMGPIEDFPSVDKLMTSIGFVKQKMPSHIHDITKESKKAGAAEAAESKSHEKKSVGNFIIEGVIELFESALTYITNTMSFLRIGGFVLSHAGLMLVVNILAEKAGEPGGVGWIITQIIGNAFVIGMEGFLVGIQVLRLEFYEMFSRFHKSTGKPFKPIVIDFDNHN